jgi:hypothetical protein
MLTLVLCFAVAWMIPFRPRQSAASMFRTPFTR